MRYSDEALKHLREVATGKYSENDVYGLDDAYMMQYLLDYGHCGKAHDKVAEQYKEVMGEEREPGYLTTLFRFSQNEALELIEEVERFTAASA